MELVEDDRPDALGGRVVLQPPDQHPFGDDLDDRVGRGALVLTSGDADGAADGFAEQVGHAFGCRACRDPAGFEHHDPAGQPSGVAHRQRHERRLARTRRRLEDGHTRVVERIDDVTQHLLHRQGGQIGVGGWTRS